MEVKIKNFQSIKEAHITVTGLTVITGQNSIGKSAVARAIKGVFSNLKGNSFVRKGEASTEVEVTFEDGSSVVWEKGKKKNDYTINGKNISKVGNQAPEEIKDLKVHSIELDGKDLWPQFSKQFEQIFLLDMPPSVLASALSDTDNIKVLEKSTALVKKELRDIKSRLKVKREDLKKTEETLNKFKGFDISLLKRTEDLSNNLKTLDESIFVLEKLLKKRERSLYLIEEMKDAQFEIKDYDFSKFQNIPLLVNLKRKKQSLFNLYHLIYFSLLDVSLPDTKELSQKNKIISEYQKTLSTMKKHSQTIEVYEKLFSITLPSDFSLPRDLTSVQEKRKKLVLGLSKGEQEIARMNEELESIRKEVTEGVCPLCLREGESHV